MAEIERIIVVPRALMLSIQLLLPGWPTFTSIGWLAMELRSGETYVLICSLRDNPDAPRHFDLGMYSAFAVR